MIKKNTLLTMLKRLSVFQGALSGICGATFATVWIFCGKIIYPVPKEFQQVLPLSSNYCIRSASVQSKKITTELPSCWNATTTWEDTTTITNVTASLRPLVADLYAMSYMYLTAFGFIIGMCLGVAISLLTGESIMDKIVQSQIQSTM